MKKVDYGDESKYIMNDCRVARILNPTKTFDQRFMSNMLGSKLKYKADTSWTTEALDVDDRTSADNDKDVTNSKFLYSMALVHEITAANVVALFYPRMTRQEQANYYVGPFRLQSFKLINEGAYSNTLTNQFADGQSIPIETNETLKYAITGKFEGCIGDLLNEFKIGCVSRDTSGDKINNNRVQIAQSRCLDNSIELRLKALEEQKQASASGK